MNPAVLAKLEPAIALARPAVQKVAAALPAPLVTQAIHLLGPDCYSRLALDFDPLGRPECVSLAVSKALSLAIVGSSAIVKLPQLFKLLSSMSADGVSFPAYALEITSQLIGTAYAVQNEFPFTTYGETVLIAVQNFVISLLILHLKGKNALAGVWLAVVAAAIGAFFNQAVPAHVLNLLQMGGGVLAMASKVPQITEVWSQGHTGNLSAFAVFSYLFGSLARIFTTLQEVNDPIILLSVAGSAFLSFVQVIQMVWYWNVVPVQYPRLVEPTASEKKPEKKPETAGHPVPSPTTSSVNSAAGSTQRRRAP